MTLMFPVAVADPGISPIKLQNRITKKKVQISGRNLWVSSPRNGLTISSRM